jgi:two-component system chemotaxis response regulator CheV
MQDDKAGILLKSGTNEVEFIEVFIGSVSYGINVSKVQQVFAKATVEVTDVPEKPQGVVGVMYFRKEPILLVDLRAALGITESLDEKLKERQMVVVTRFNKSTTGFLIDGVSKIHRTSWNDFEPAGFDYLSSSSNFVVGTIRIEERVVLILDLERLLADITPSHDADHQVHATETQRERRAKIRILYAEDSKMVRTITLKTLAEAGFQDVTSFDNGAAAFDFIRGVQEKARAENKTVRDYIDLIITDIEMPKMDGLTLCKQVKESAGVEHIPSVVVYSSLINEEMARKCRSVGADAQLSKPHGTEIVQLADKLCGINA